MLAGVSGLGRALSLAVVGLAQTDSSTVSVKDDAGLVLGQPDPERWLIR